MGFLSLSHIYSILYDYANYTLDVTGPMMIFTQKLTSLAFAYHDGMKPDNQLSPDQLSQAIKHKPHIFEFLSFVFNFQGIIAGPLCFYQDYIEFINGNNILKKKV
jgi:lysophospholipid acyltransferase 1/2